MIAVYRLFRIWVLALPVLLAAFAAPVQASEAGDVTHVLKSYLQAMYARDADAAYALVTKADRDEKSLVDYRTETGSYTGAALALSWRLAEAIRFAHMKVVVEGERASVTFSAHLPDANHPSLDAIVKGFDRDALAELSEAETATRLSQLTALARERRLPVIETKDESWELIRGADGWRVFLNWAEAIEVHFSAALSKDLNWEFVPGQSRVLAKPGETIEMAYRVRNLGAHKTTGKARHIIGPQAQAEHMEIISCFCFLEQTLEPGEEATLPLVFRIDFDAPEALRKFSVHYDFYPLKRFPEGAAG